MAIGEGEGERGWEGRRRQECERAFILLSHIIVMEAGSCHTSVASSNEQPGFRGRSDVCSHVRIAGQLSRVVCPDLLLSTLGKGCGGSLRDIDESGQN